MTRQTGSLQPWSTKNGSVWTLTARKALIWFEKIYLQSQGPFTPSRFQNGSRQCSTRLPRSISVLSTPAMSVDRHFLWGTISVIFFLFFSLVSSTIFFSLVSSTKKNLSYNRRQKKRSTWRCHHRPLVLPGLSGRAPTRAHISHRPDCFHVQWRPCCVHCGLLGFLITSLTRFTNTSKQMCGRPTFFLVSLCIGAFVPQSTP